MMSNGRNLERIEEMLDVMLIYPEPLGASSFQFHHRNESPTQRNPADTFAGWIDLWEHDGRAFPLDSRQRT